MAACFVVARASDMFDLPDPGTSHSPLTGVNVTHGRGRMGVSDRCRCCGLLHNS